ncbi:MAG: hypothetical protein U1D29_03325 [Burkholderiales bacterium]|nr:hypothetical protein [Burkholderiales bacterium]
MLNPTSLLLLLAAAAHSSAQTPPGAVAVRHDAAAEHRMGSRAAQDVKAQPVGVAPAVASAPADVTGRYTGLDHAELRRQLRQQYDERTKAKNSATAKVNP